MSQRHGLLWVERGPRPTPAHLLWRLAAIERLSARVCQVCVLRVVRDPVWLHARLAALRADEVVARRALVISLGLLGAAVEYEAACPNAGAGEDAATWVFSTVLADVARAAERTAAASGLANGASGEVLDTASSRIAMGYALSASG